MKVRVLGLGVLLLVACSGKVSPNEQDGASSGDGGGLAAGNPIGDADAAGSAHGWVAVGEPFGVSKEHPTPTSLTIDPSGAPIVGMGNYQDGLSTTTYRFDGSTWAAIDQLGGSCNSVRFDASGGLHAPFAMRSADGLHELFSLKEAQGTTWTTSPTFDFAPLDADGVCDIFAVAPDGTAYLATQTGDAAPGVTETMGVSVAQFDGSQWQLLGSSGVVPSVTDASGNGPAPIWIQMDGTGAPIVAVQTAEGSSDHEYTFHRWNGTAWDDFGSPLAPVSLANEFEASFALDPSGVLYASSSEYGYYEPSPGPTVRRLNAGVWETIGTPVQLAGLAWPDAGAGWIATDSQGRLTLAFESATPNAIAVRRWDPSTASWTNLDGVVLPLPANITGISGIGGSAMYLAIGPDDTPFVSYSVQDNAGRDGAVVKRWVP